MPEVTFLFDSEKLIQALAYMAHRGVQRLDKLKAAKMLYFCDKYHLLKYGRPVLGDHYACMEHGPVPSESLDVMNAVISPGSRVIDGEVAGLFDRYLSVDRNAYYPEFRSKRAPDLEMFSGSELEALEATVQQYGQYSPWELRQLTHQDPTWVIRDGERPTGSSVPISYRLFFEGQSEDVRAIWEVVEEEQEETAFADKIGG